MISGWRCGGGTAYPPVSSSTRSASGETTMEWLDKSCCDFRYCLPEANEWYDMERASLASLAFWALISRRAARVLITTEALLQLGLASMMTPYLTSEISK